MQPYVEAYLDIETTGLSPRTSEITVIGIHLVSDVNTEFIQLVGADITADEILKKLIGVSVIYTYNGSRCREIAPGWRKAHERGLDNVKKCHG